MKSKLAAPIAFKKKHIHEIHGQQRSDDYFWLRDDKREDPKILNYLKIIESSMVDNLKVKLVLQKSYSSLH